MDAAGAAGTEATQPGEGIGLQVAVEGGHARPDHRPTPPVTLRRGDFFSRPGGGLPAPVTGGGDGLLPLTNTRKDPMPSPGCAPSRRSAPSLWPGGDERRDHSAILLFLKKNISIYFSFEKVVSIYIVVIEAQKTDRFWISVRA